MRPYQPISLPLDEAQASVPGEPVETLVTLQVAALEKPILGEKKSVEKATETVVVSPPRHRQFTLPPWPTSQPGPRVTAPSPGQRLVPRRTDQVMYDFYDQERGLPGLLPPMPADQERKSASENATDSLHRTSSRRATD